MPRGKLLDSKGRCESLKDSLSEKMRCRKSNYVKWLLNKQMRRSTRIKSTKWNKKWLNPRKIFPILKRCRRTPRPKSRPSSRKQDRTKHLQILEIDFTTSNCRRNKCKSNHRQNLQAMMAPKLGMRLVRALSERGNTSRRPNMTQIRPSSWGRIGPSSQHRRGMCRAAQHQGPCILECSVFNSLVGPWRKPSSRR